MPDADRTLGVLFLCTGNSARSILAEAILNHLGEGRVRAWSAGSMPAGRVNPHALKLLERLGHPTEGLRSKSWDEFAAPGAPALDVIVTVCDNAAGEVCPIWPGRPTTGHWGLPDPAAAPEAEITAAFEQTYRALTRKISSLLDLPLADLDPPALKARLAELADA